MKFHVVRADRYLTFWCPGCDEPHGIRIEGPSPWTWNGSLETPTVQPSILVTSGHYVAGWKGPDCWCTWNAARPENPSGFTCDRCHSFVAEGKIQFLPDSTHK